MQFTATKYVFCEHRGGQPIPSTITGRSVCGLACCLGDHQREGKGMPDCLAYNFADRIFFFFGGCKGPRTKIKKLAPHLLGMCLPFVINCFLCPHFLFPDWYPVCCTHSVFIVCEMLDLFLTWKPVQRIVLAMRWMRCELNVLPDRHLFLATRDRLIVP